MRYLKNYITEFSQCYYKIGHNETNLDMFYDKLSYSINFIIKKNTSHGLRKKMSSISSYKNLLSKKMG